MNDNVVRPGALLLGLVSRISGRYLTCIQRVKTILNIDIQYQYNSFSIMLPAEHLLPSYQKRHKLYDRFLPHLVKYLAPGSTVVDVGANCGDTLAAMYESNRSLAFICVEPDQMFFKYLENNVLRIREFDENATIKTVNSLVGKHITSASLEGNGGTRRAVVCDRIIAESSLSLDDILSQGKVTHIRLLKSDVDGFDYDVIDSAESIIEADAPILFFECQFDQAFQKIGYEKMIAILEVKGYGEWVIFDNYGEVVLRTGDIQIVKQLFDYVWRQNTGRSTRTICYYDILAVTQRDSNLIARVLGDYIADFSTVTPGDGIRESSPQATPYNSEPPSLDYS
jgi:FkbM family methyltransferase